MYISRSDIFWKSWWWSIICGIVAAVVFWTITGIGNIFDWLYTAAAFVDLLIAFSIGGSYFGAGYVGWRIAEKYYNDHEKRFVRQYTKCSLVTLLVLVLIIFSPLSFLGILWSFIAPLCVLWALDHVKERHKV